MLSTSWWRNAVNGAEFPPFAAFLVTLSLILLTLLAAAWNRRRKHAPIPPGPLGLPLVGYLPFLSPSLHRHFTSLAQSYGPILSLQLGQKLCVVVTSPSLAKEILKDHDVTFANRDVPATARTGVYGGKSILWSSYGPEWRMLRKIGVQQMTGGAALDSTYHGVRRGEIRQTIRHLYLRAGSPVNLGEQLVVTVLNTVTGMMWSRTVKGGLMVAEEREGLGAEFRRLVGEFTLMLGTPNVSDFFPLLRRFDLQGVQKRMKECSGRFDKIFDEIITQRLTLMDQNEENESGRRKDFLQILLELKNNAPADGKTPLTITHAKALFTDMIFGATDTTTSTMEYAMAEIMNKPEVMNKLQQEIDTIVGKDNIVEESHIHKLPYLLAVVKETLRLYPSVPFGVPHHTSKSCMVGGYTIPEGSQVIINIWGIQRDPSIWENPSEFVPERFLHGKYDFNGGNDFIYMPFSSGRRMCPGTVMAERTMMLTLASLLHSFDWKLPQGEKLDLEEEPGIVMRKKTPLMLIPSPRLPKPSLYE